MAKRLFDSLKENLKNISEEETGAPARDYNSERMANSLDAILSELEVMTLLLSGESGAAGVQRARKLTGLSENQITKERIKEIVEEKLKEALGDK